MNLRNFYYAIFRPRVSAIVHSASKWDWDAEENVHRTRNFRLVIDHGLRMFEAKVALNEVLEDARRHPSGLKKHKGPEAKDDPGDDPKRCLPMSQNQSRNVLQDEEKEQCETLLWLCRAGATIALRK